MQATSWRLWSDSIAGFSKLQPEWPYFVSPLLSSTFLA